MARPERRIFKCDKITMEVLGEYGSILEAAKASGVPYDVAYSGCKRKSVGCYPFVFRYAEDYDPNESFEGKFIRPVTVMDVEKGECVTFYSPNDAACQLYTSKDTIFRAIKRKEVVLGCYLIKYAR